MADHRLRRLSSSVEIGRTPRRDRSGSGSRSVVLRVEIGCTPVRDCSQGWRPYKSGRNAAGRLRQCSRLPGAVHVAHLRAPCIAGNLGIMRKSNVGSGHGSVPMCVDPLTAHGSSTATHKDPRKIPSFQQKPTRVPQRPRSPMCNTDDPHVHQAHPPRPAPRSVHFRLEIGPVQLGQSDVEVRTTSSRAKRAEATCHTSEPSVNSRLAEPDRSRCGLRPISMRSATDLGAECDRFRRGLRPVSSRNWTDLGGLRRLRRPRSSWDPQSARGGPTPAGSGPPRRVHRSRAR